MVKVIISKVDPVGQSAMKLNLPFEYVVDDRDVIYLDDLDKRFPNEDLFIVISRHESKSKIPIFSAHFTGELDKRKVGWTYPSYHKVFLQRINKMNPEYEVTTEPMHHGPVLSKPVLFVEIGSSPNEWSNLNAVKKLVEVVNSLLTEKPKKATNAIGIGMNHYPKKFTELILNDEYAFGPIVSKYYVDYITEEVFKELVEKSVEKIQVAFIDKKVKMKREIERWCNELDIELVRV